MVLLLLTVLATATPQRIISLAPSVTEILFALGAGDRIIGVSTYCDYPPEATRIDRIGTFLQPNVERIVAKRPDLVIGVPSPGNRASVERLQELGLTVLIVDPEQIADILDSIRTIGQAIGRPAEAATLVTGIEGEIAAVTARLAGAPRPRVLLLVGRAPFVAAGAGTYPNELVRLAQAENLGATAGPGWPSVNLEWIVAQSPDIIIDSSMGSETAGDLAFWDAFPTIPAVREKRIYGQTTAELIHPGPRVAGTLESLARLIHPERFAITPTGANESRDTSAGRR